MSVPLTELRFACFATILTSAKASRMNVSAAAFSAAIASFENTRGLPLLVCSMGKESLTTSTNFDIGMPSSEALLLDCFCEPELGGGARALTSPVVSRSLKRVVVCFSPRHGLRGDDACVSGCFSRRRRLREGDAGCSGISTAAASDAAMLGF